MELSSRGENEAVYAGMRGNYRVSIPPGSRFMDFKVSDENYSRVSKMIGCGEIRTQIFRCIIGPTSDGPDNPEVWWYRRGYYKPVLAENCIGSPRDWRCYRLDREDYPEESPDPRGSDIDIFFTIDPPEDEDEREEDDDREERDNDDEREEDDDNPVRVTENDDNERPEPVPVREEPEERPAPQPEPEEEEDDDDECGPPVCKDRARNDRNRRRKGGISSEAFRRHRAEAARMHRESGDNE